MNYRLGIYKSQSEQLSELSSPCKTCRSEWHRSWMMRSVIELFKGNSKVLSWNLMLFTSTKGVMQEDRLLSRIVQLVWLWPQSLQLSSKFFLSHTQQGLTIKWFHSILLIFAIHSLLWIPWQFEPKNFSLFVPSSIIMFPIRAMWK